MVWTRKHWIHILIWAMMLVYLAAAPGLYARFFLIDGKPVSLAQELPASTAQIMCSADRMDPIIVGSQSLYNLWGWAFTQVDEDQSNYDRYVVFSSDARTYYFPVETTARPDVQTYFADLHRDVANTGFNAQIAKEAIRPGTYQIGVLFKSKISATAYYGIATKKIVKTANQFKMEIP